MKIGKEIRVGLICIIAIVFLILGVNYLKGSTFFGGDDLYYGYFSDSGGLMPASSVMVNGVGIGKVLSIELIPTAPRNKVVKVTFSVQNDNVRIPKGTVLQIGSLDFFTKALVLKFPETKLHGFVKVNAHLQGEVSKDMMQQMQAYADPITKKLQRLMGNVDKVVESFSAFWDTTASTEIQSSFIEIRSSIKRFGDLSLEMQELVQNEKTQLSAILTNVAGITENLSKSNLEIKAIIGNTKKITDDMVTSDFKKVVNEANKSLITFNNALDGIDKGKGTLGKLLKDERFYNELLKSNSNLQELLEDLKEHPERYIKMSIFGRKSKGLKLTKRQEQKLKKIVSDTVIDLN